MKKNQNKGRDFTVCHAKSRLLSDKPHSSGKVGNGHPLSFRKPVAIVLGLPDGLKEFPALLHVLALLTRRFSSACRRERSASSLSSFASSRLLAAWVSSSSICSFRFCCCRRVCSSLALAARTLLLRSPKWNKGMLTFNRTEKLASSREILVVQFQTMYIVV